jgi:hypothetical protein
MTRENKNYDKVMDVLKNSKPVFNDADAVSEKIINRIREEKSSLHIRETIEEFLFGWVYVGWVRRSMIAAALVIVVFFGYQQSLILKRIAQLPEQKIPDSEVEMTKYNDELSNRLMLYRIKGEQLTDKELEISKKEIDQLIKSMNKLQLKYHDLFYLIEKDPELKKYVSEKLKVSPNFEN